MTRLSSDLLAEAMAAYRRNPSPERSHDIFRALDVSALIVPAEHGEPYDANFTSSPKPRRLRLRVQRDPDGSSTVSAFTDAAKLRAFRPEGTETVSLFGRDLLRTLMTGPPVLLAINPDHPDQIFLPPQQIAALADRPEGTLGRLLRRPVVHDAEQRIDFLVLVEGSETTAWVRELAEALNQRSDALLHAVLEDGPLFLYLDLPLGAVRGYTTHFHICGLPPSRPAPHASSSSALDLRGLPTAGGPQTRELALMAPILASRANAVLRVGGGGEDELSRRLTEFLPAEVPNFVLGGSLSPVGRRAHSIEAKTRPVEVLKVIATAVMSAMRG